MDSSADTVKPDVSSSVACSTHKAVIKKPKKRTRISDLLGNDNELVRPYSTAVLRAMHELRILFAWKRELLLQIRHFMKKFCCDLKLNTAGVRSDRVASKWKIVFANMIDLLEELAADINVSVECVRKFEKRYMSKNTRAAELLTTGTGIEWSEHMRQRPRWLDAPGELVRSRIDDGSHTTGLLPLENIPNKSLQLVEALGRILLLMQNFTKQSAGDGGCAREAISSCDDGDALREDGSRQLLCDAVARVQAHVERLIAQRPVAVESSLSSNAPIAREHERIRKTLTVIERSVTRLFSQPRSTASQSSSANKKSSGSGVIVRKSVLKSTLQKTTSTTTTTTVVHLTGTSSNNKLWQQSKQHVSGITTVSSSSQGKVRVSKAGAGGGDCLSPIMTPMSASFASTPDKDGHATELERPTCTVWVSKNKLLNSLLGPVDLSAAKAAAATTSDVNENADEKPNMSKAARTVQPVSSQSTSKPIEQPPRVCYTSPSATVFSVRQVSSSHHHNHARVAAVEPIQPPRTANTIIAVPAPPPLVAVQLVPPTLPKQQTNILLPTMLSSSYAVTDAAQQQSEYVSSSSVAGQQQFETFCCAGSEKPVTIVVVTSGTQPLQQQQYITPCAWQQPVTTAASEYDMSLHSHRAVYNNASYHIDADYNAEQFIGADALMQDDLLDGFFDEFLLGPSASQEEDDLLKTSPLMFRNDMPSMQPTIKHESTATSEAVGFDSLLLLESGQLYNDRLPTARTSTGNFYTSSNVLLPPVSSLTNNNNNTAVAVGRQPPVPVEMMTERTTGTGGTKRSVSTMAMSSWNGASCHSGNYVHGNAAVHQQQQQSGTGEQNAELLKQFRSKSARLGERYASGSGSEQMSEHTPTPASSLAFSSVTMHPASLQTMHSKSGSPAVLATGCNEAVSLQQQQPQWRPQPTTTLMQQQQQILGHATTIPSGEYGQQQQQQQFGGWCVADISQQQQQQHQHSYAPLSCRQRMPSSPQKHHQLNSQTLMLSSSGVATSTEEAVNNNFIADNRYADFMDIYTAYGADGSVLSSQADMTVLAADYTTAVSVTAGGGAVMVNAPASYGGGLGAYNVMIESQAPVQLPMLNNNRANNAYSSNVYVQDANIQNWCTTSSNDNLV